MARAWSGSSIQATRQWTFANLLSKVTCMCRKVGMDGAQEGGDVLPRFTLKVSDLFSGLA